MPRTQTLIVNHLAEALSLSQSDADWLRHTLTSFAVPTTWHVEPVLRAFIRLSRSIPWASELLSSEDFHDPASRVLSKIEHSTLAGPDGISIHLRDDFKGDFQLAGTLLSADPDGKPPKCFEAFRIVLVSCRRDWVETDSPQESVLRSLASAIRGATRTSIDPMLLSRLGEAQTLTDFIEVASGLAESSHVTLASAWRNHFDPYLRGTARPARPVSNNRPVALRLAEAALPLSLETRDKAPPGEKETHERLHRSRGAGSQPRPKSAPELLDGELIDEVSPAVFAPALPLAPTNPDSTAVQRYQVQQAIWSANHLLLPNHPDVLPFQTCAAAVQKMLEILGDPTTGLELRYGTSALLVQALTGRTARTLTAVDVLVDGSAEHNSIRLELLLAEGAFRLSPFWQVQRGTSSPGYFRPTKDQQLFLETTHPSFMLPLAPPILEVFRANSDALESLSSVDILQTEGWLRHAARHLGDAQGVPLTPGQLRASFATHLFEHCRDMAAVQLICADTLGQSIAPLSYYAPKARTLATIHWTLQNRLLDVDHVMPRVAESGVRVGSKLLVTNRHTRAMARASSALFRNGVKRLMDAGRVHDVHTTMVNQLAGMLLAVATHRPTQALFRLTLSDFWIDGNVGAALFQDKVIDAAHEPRLVALPSMVCRQLTAYLEHIVGLGEQVPALDAHVAKVLSGKAPLLFSLSEQGTPTALDLERWKRGMPEVWGALPMNWGRHWSRTHAIEKGVRPELVNTQMGHLEVVGYPFSGASPTEPWMFIQEVGKDWDAVATGQGWQVVRGIEASRAVAPMTLTALRPWNQHISQHETAQRALSKEWGKAMQAQLRIYRTQAEACVRADPELITAGIITRYLDKSASAVPHSLTQQDFERIRDRLYEAAGDDMALAIAHADALCRIASVVNRRTGQKTETPGRIFTLRRPLDNAFVPRMMEALRQVHALREHVVDMDKRAGASQWVDVASASSVTVLAMVLFGHCEFPDRIKGAIERRAQMRRSATLEDVVLVPWGDASHEVIALRGVAAITFARLAWKFRKEPMPDWNEVICKLAALLPAWALGTGASSGLDTDRVFAHLCETVSVANRYELSPAARRADAARGGSTAAHLDEQIAFIDGDPAGTLQRTWELPENITHTGPVPGEIRVRKGNARTQYLKLCAVLPATGTDTQLTLTQKVIASGQAMSKASRALVVAEIQAQIDAEDPERCLHPIVRALAGWSVDMLVNGTAKRAIPAISTVRTYLTRIGGALVHLFGQSSPADADDGALEEAYLTAIGSKAGFFTTAAAAILSFHRYAHAHHGFPDLDLSSVKLHLGKDPDGLADARLTLPSEREAILTRLATRANAPAACHEMRVARQAAQIMPLMAIGGMRRGEALGLQFRDVAAHGQRLSVHVRPNQSRWLKTANARRRVEIPLASTTIAGATLADWITIERKRLPQRRLETAYLFSTSEAPFDATARARIRDACVQVCRDVTGRPSARLHHLRHLVAMEATTSAFLSEDDQTALATNLALVPTPTKQGLLALPRDLQGQVIGIGHGNPSTTLRSYHHVPWLLSSRTAQRMTHRYMNPAHLAPLLGITRHALHWAVKQRPGRARGLAWLDIQVDRRTRPRVINVQAQLAAPSASQVIAAPIQLDTGWTARSIGDLLRDVARVGSLDDALLVMGGNISDAAVIRKGLYGMEYRLGMRLLNEFSLPSEQGHPTRAIRGIKTSRELEILWDWYDKDEHGLRGVLAHLADAANEYMRPRQGDRLLLGDSESEYLLSVLGRLGIDQSRVEVEPSSAGLVSIRVRRQANSPSTSDLKSIRYLGLELKRVLLVIRFIARTQIDSNTVIPKSSTPC